MYVINISYTKSPTEVEAQKATHGAWVEKYRANGTILFAGPKKSGYGGIVLIKSMPKPDDEPIDHLPLRGGVQLSSCGAPLQRGDVAMLVILPNQGVSLAQLETSLGASGVDSILKALSPSTVTLLGHVSCGVDVGGPLGLNALDGAFLRGLPNGMPGIMGNAMRLDRYPDQAVSDQLLSGFSLRQQGLLDANRRINPLLVINGEADQYIPPIDTVGMRAFPAAEVWVVKNATHCAVEKFSRIVPAMIAWLRLQLHGATVTNRALLGTARGVLPALA